MLPNFHNGIFIVMKSLSELVFSDLLISQGEYYFRYLEGQDLPVVKVPADYRPEVESLREKLPQMVEKEQDSFFMFHEGAPYRVSVVETIEGTGYFLRKLRYPTPVLSTLGFQKGVLNTLINLGCAGQGLILVSGATGSGKSTTVYSLLKEYLINYGDILISIEDPPEVPSQGCLGNGIWFQIDAEAAGGYENAMISAMRYNPKYIFMGEIRTPAAAREAIRAAVNGHLVITTIHANSIQGAIYSLQQIAASGSDIELVRSILSDGLLCVIQQRLDFIHGGLRQLKADFLYTKELPAIGSKIRSGKLELLNTEIEMQKIKLSRGDSLTSSN
ncbi:type II/IV secretion system family protein [Salmonella enterica]|nr:type II/IV secretion system family protein [Salmonella enterica]ECC9414367.1 type II/IV secretion system family protein [Salmonella enterica subsp. enterica]EHF1447885.1 Flp pilus assembly complex ATPase component [Salmonella enterica subsp. enterica serovar 4,5,12:b:-]EHG1528304.1 Flp pilus assembly complex ATPase component [Salmonella enterica subsp. enterica serovar 4,[5],12:b:-]ECD8848109.1 type II/IV secretion system family protein [Salmonella enterica subsp. enterica]